MIKSKQLYVTRSTWKVKCTFLVWLQSLQLPELHSFCKKSPWDWCMPGRYRCGPCINFSGRTRKLSEQKEANSSNFLKTLKIDTNNKRRQWAYFKWLQFSSLFMQVDELSTKTVSLYWYVFNTVREKQAWVTVTPLLMSNSCLMSSCYNESSSTSSSWWV